MFLQPGLLSLICLTGLGLLCFWPTVKHVGFYLDDWIMLNTLSNGPDGFWECFKYYFLADNRVVKRPIEALHFLVMFKMFGLRPVGYHIFNLIMEILAAWLFYFCLVRMTGQRILALIGASLFLLYPSHNATHYWVVCSSVTLSLIFYFGSLLASIEGEVQGKFKLHLLSALLFLLGVLNYEVFVPLALINLLVVFLIACRKEGIRHGFQSVFWPGVTYGFASAVAGAYISWVVEAVGSAWLHQVRYDFNLMFSTVAKGFFCNVPFVAFSFFFEKIDLIFQYGVILTDWFLALAIFLLFSLSTICLMLFSRSGENSSDIEQSIFPEVLSLREKSLPLLLFLLGLITVLVSYTIFGLNESYEPTFDTLVNRVNTGASIGVTFMFLAIVMFIISSFSTKKNEYSRILYPTIGLSALLLVIYSFTNWSLSRSYRLSWQLQSHIIKSIVDNKHEFSGVKSLLLANVPRYVDEAPVFDGVWDFQPMAQLMLKPNKINAGVVSDRLKIQGDKLVDCKGPMILGTYKFDGLSVLLSPTCELIRIDSASEFIRLIETRGMTYEINKSLPSQWRLSIEKKDSEL